MFGEKHNGIVNLTCYVQYAIIGLFIFVQIPIVIFCWTEGWTLFESFYFIITSLSAVGLGDFTPSFKTIDDSVGLRIFSDIYRFGAIIWLFFGMPFMVSLLQLAFIEMGTPYFGHFWGSL